MRPNDSDDDNNPGGRRAAREGASASPIITIIDDDDDDVGGTAGGGGAGADDDFDSSTLLEDMYRMTCDAGYASAKSEFSSEHGEPSQDAAVLLNQQKQQHRRLSLSSLEKGEEDSHSNSRSRSELSSASDITSSSSLHSHVAPSSRSASVLSSSSFAHSTSTGATHNNNWDGSDFEASPRRVDAAAAAASTVVVPSAAGSSRTRPNPLELLQRPIESLSDDQLVAELHHWFSIWCPENCPRHEFFIHLDDLYGPIFTEGALKQRHIGFTRQMCKLKRELMIRQLYVPGQEESTDLNDHLCMVMSAMFDAHDIVIKQQRMLLSHNPRTRAQLPKDETMHSYYLPSDPNRKPYQRLLLFLVQRCGMDALAKRKDGECLYRPRFVETENETECGPFTYSYSQSMTFEDYVHRSVFPRETYEQQWEWLHDGRTNGMAAAKYLAQTYDYNLPFISKDRHILSFRNGVYMMPKDKFLSYDNPVHQRYLGQYMGTGELRRAAAKYHDLVFDNEGFKQNIRDNGNDWYGLPTPVFQSILDYQDFNEEVCRWVYVFYGRMFYFVGELDNWQIQLFTLGVAGSGKSTSLRHLGRIYEKEDVGILGNNIQPDFAVEAIVDSFFYMALDINKDFKLDQTMWQSMVSGEEVSVSRKHRIALIKVWSSPGMLVGNVTPRWSDNADSVARRIALLDFCKVVRASDPRLFERLHEELAVFIKKCNCGYLLATKEYGDRYIWEVLPQYFKQKKKELRSKTNALSAFLQDSGQVTLRPHVWMKMDEFKVMFQEYCQEHKKPIEDMTDEYYSAIFQHMNIKVEKRTKRLEQCNEPDSNMVTAMWVMNVCPSSYYGGSDNPLDDPASQESPIIMTRRDDDDDDDEYGDEDEDDDADDDEDCNNGNDAATAPTNDEDDEEAEYGFHFVKPA